VSNVAALADFAVCHPRLLVLTGAGCSTGSGIPDYRDASGAWRHRRPVQYAEFVRSPAVRRRYWARSLAGWPRVAAARPNAAHGALARLEACGRVALLVTQNVDGLQQRAGSRRVLDLHGRLDVVECLACGARLARAELQLLLAAWNPAFARFADAEATPDGDARLDEADFDAFLVPDCPECGGILKPGVVFFGENVPGMRVDTALAALAAADALLVVGSSLMVYSGYRFCLAAVAQGKPVAAVNLGRTRADALLALKLERDCGTALGDLLRALDALGHSAEASQHHVRAAAVPLGCGPCCS
jgi:NAD-dependent SIR2 family protein deacetylase